LELTLAIGRLIIRTEPKIIYKNTFPITLTPKMATFFDKRDLGFMLRTAVTPKFKMRWFPNEGRY